MKTIFKDGETVEISWLNHSKEFCVIAASSIDNSFIVQLLSMEENKMYRLHVIPENYSGHKKQPENFTLMDEKGNVLAIDAKVRHIGNDS